jgi:DNA-binding transcriptional ArsR family regulator
LRNVSENDSLYKEGRDSIFLDIFGTSPETRIIDFFLDNPLFDFSRIEMTEALGMAKITMYNTLPKIEAMGIVNPSRKIGKSQLYKLNSESNIVKNLRRIIQDVSMKIAELEENSESELEEEVLAGMEMYSNL